MPPFYFIIMFLVFVVSITSFVDGKEIKNCNTTVMEITKNNDLPSNTEALNLSSIELSPRSTIPSTNLEAYMSTVEIITSRGYHAQMHPVTTDDDYILMLHRIPYPKGQTSGPITGRPIFIQVGFGGSSADFILLPSEKSLAFILADLGYDVWLGNFRGNTYSRGHVTFDSSRDDAYWKFSFDEMGRYDLPAVINHVLNVTSRNKLVYIGYSMGSTAFFICMDYHPELNNKVELMVALAPATTLAQIKVMVRYILPFNRLVQFLLWLFGFTTTFLSQEDPFTRYARKHCLANAQLYILCQNAYSFIFGADYGNMNPDLIRVVNYHHPAGVSIRTLIHFGQNVALDWKFRQKFKKYNYGWIGNLKHYGELNPPAYNLSKTTVPIYVFHGANDYAATPKDIAWTVSKLPNVKKVVLVDDPRFNHLDMAFHRNAKELLYNKIVALLPPP